MRDAARERRSAYESEFMGDFSWFTGSFIVWKGVTKYVLIKGAFMAATGLGAEISGDDVVNAPDTVTEPIDQTLSSFTGVEMNPAETFVLPFAYFVEHIHVISLPVALAELIAFSFIGIALRGYGRGRTGKTDKLYERLGV